MTPNKALHDTALMILCTELAALNEIPAGRGAYRARVYRALTAANDLGYNTGFVQGTTASGATVINAVICLPTGAVSFRVPWFIGHVGQAKPGEQEKAIADFLTNTNTDTLPLMRDPRRCCPRCHVWETREGTYCHNTSCRCHRKVR